jgi:2-dehydro-3-deoxyphosphogluconate aldolase/(4S)-4-hydroxy-2-oxoglutarate aldolase
METFLFYNLYSLGVIPIIEIESADLAVPLAESLCEAGLPIIEVTLRTDAALESIRRIAQSMPKMLLGAGTVINREQAQAAHEAGAQFIVSPGLDEKVVIWGQKNDVPILPGAVTPTEIMLAMSLGLNLLKFFPAEALGGLKAIKAISDPFPQVRFIPTGGVKAGNLAEYLQTDKIHAVGGSWMAKRQMIIERKFDEINRLAKEARGIVKQVRV